MAQGAEKVFAMLEENQARFIDFRFTDPRGKWQHMTLPAHGLDQDTFEEGFTFDGSSIDGWKEIHESDMLLVPDPDSAFLDPFYEEPTIVLTCDVAEPDTMEGYNRDPRSVAKRAEAYLQSSGIGDTAFFGPEPEFFMFDSVKWDVKMEKCGYQIDSEEGVWNSGADFEGGNRGHRPAVKGGYFPVPPVDSSQDLRSAMSLTLQKIGITPEIHHHEVATANQNEVGFRFTECVGQGDQLQKFKYVVHNVAAAYGKTATFMPKPVVGDNGTGMHVHQSIWKDGENRFAGDKYGGLSQEALYYIGGIIKHAKAINAFTNASTNSYKRLVPGFEAPVLLAYSNRNRSASIRIPAVSSPKGRRIEVRFPDPTANPYLAFAALLMAGIDGIENKIDPGEALDKNLYDLPPEEVAEVPHVASSFEEALDALDADRAFLTKGGVFTDDAIDGYLELRREEVDQVRMTTHPMEFALYYSV
ncbi:glutamine synthetase [Thiohalorhabdus denitrificans]|uniref:Glutamine synthetase n=1 Tax=Thiohalorhabdus denitrificans TaxID=381306 RepID=A0A0P9C4N2_9GAMM|nr:type I glutamate--ammonia ligase [Thiohalorhabdus denitrificans]KPV39952.1 glutamine synthetase [Thiohalorhabdus denitrificans]SCY09628.1 glutamine synthetase [Thiohalorhabdus denitrificans]